MTFSQIFGAAKWVEPSSECTAPLIRGSFFADDISKAVINICGLGFFRLWINGKEASQDKLVPANSQYCKRDLSDMIYPFKDEMSYRTYCMSYDITALLHSGKNTIAVVLGTGWFTQRDRGAEGSVDYGNVKLCYKIDIEHRNGSHTQSVSDEKLLWKPSRIVKNNIYMGEVHDFSLESGGDYAELNTLSGFNHVKIAPTHECEYYIQTCPADRTVRTLSPKKLYDFGDRSIYDAGENISGFAVVAADSAVQNITVRYAEELKPDGNLDFTSCGDVWQIQQESFLNVPKGVHCAPWFTWHGFRYFELSNNARPVCCEVVHADVPVTSSFESDNEILNWLYDAYIRTQLSNMHSGVPSDCPHIERLGYTGDGQLCCEAAMLMLDSRSFYEKWLGDIEDCQDVNTGHVQHTAPYAGGGGGPAGWGGAIAVVPYMYYKIYGDKEVLRRFLPKMLKYFDYMEAHSYHGLVWHEEDGGWCLGDWCSPGGIKISETYVNTCLYIRYMLMAQQMADIIGESGRTEHLTERIERCKQAVNAAYFSPQTHSFMGGIQGADSFAVDIGMGDGETINKINEKYSAADCYDTGIFATDVLTRVLFENNLTDTAFHLLTSTGGDSFYNMMKNGATTLWEYWHGERSHSHPMFGAVTRFLFTFILGITQEENSAGFEKIVIAPHIPKKLNRAGGHITTVKGRIAVSFEKCGDSITLEAETPDTAKLIFEGKNYILHNGKNKFTF